MVVEIQIIMYEDDRILGQENQRHTFVMDGAAIQFAAILLSKSPLMIEQIIQSTGSYHATKGCLVVRVAREPTNIQLGRV